MPVPVFDVPRRDDWDEHDWERFLQRADARSAKYQELFETLVDHPDRDRLIAHDMGWEDRLKACGCTERDCKTCESRFECEAYEMLQLMTEPEDLEDDPESESLLACFEQVFEIPAYCAARDFASHVEDMLREDAADKSADDVRGAVLTAHMVPAQIAGGHGIGYDRESLCGNIANCKRALRSLNECISHLRDLEGQGVFSTPGALSLKDEAKQTSAAIGTWIEDLRARVWWR